MPASTASPAPAPLRGTFFLWTWLAVAFSVAICATLNWLRYEQSQTMNEANRVLAGISQARIDLSKGFLYVALAGDVSTPFRKEEGAALINQAVSSLLEARQQGIGGQPPVPHEDRSWYVFEKNVAAFRSDLAAWAQSPDGFRNADRNVLELRLRLEFHEIEQFAAHIDLANQARLSRLDARMNQTFAMMIGVSALLLGGVCLGIFLAGRNQRAAVKALHQREEQLRLVGDHLPNGYIYRYQRRPDGAPLFSYISAGVQRVHGVSAEDCRRDAMSLMALLDPAQQAPYAAAEAESARNLTEFEMDLRFRHPAGGNRMVQVRSKPVRDEAGAIIWDGLVVDVTEQRRNEEKLRKNEALLQDMGSVAKVGGWEFDVATGEGEWTEEVARIHDLAPGTKPNKELGLSFYAEPARAKITAALREAIEQGVPYDLELEFISARGTRKWVHTLGRPVFENGKVVRLRGSFQDITHLKQTELALREREHQLSLFVEHSPAAIAMLDADMHYLAVSHRWLTDYHLEEKPVLGRSHYEVFGEIPERWKEIHRRCLAGATEKRDADTFPRPDGSVDWVRWEIVPWRRDDGGIGGLIIFSEVITKQKQAEEAVRRKQQNYEEIFNASYDAICLHDAATGRVLDVNESMLRMYGFASKAEFLADDGFKAVMAEPPYDLSEARQRMRLAVDQGPQIFEWLARRKNGGEFWVEVSLRSSQIDGQGRVLAVVRDISQRKAHELEIERLNRLYSTLSEVNQVIVRCQNRQELFGEIARVMIEYGRLRAVWIGLKNADGVLVETSRRPGDPARPAAPLPDWENGADVVAEMLRTAAPAQHDCSLAAALPAGCHAASPPADIKSSAAFPLWFRGQLTGAFCLGSCEPHFFNAEETRLLGEIASDLSFALDRLDEREQARLAEQALNASERKYRGLIESSLDAIVTVDPATLKFTSGNPAALKMFGAQKLEELAGHTPLDLSPARQPDGRLSAEMVPEKIRRLMSEGSHFFEWRHRRINGEEFDASVLLSQIEWNEKPAIMSTIRDITAAKRVERALKDSEEQFRVMFETAAIGMAQADLGTGRFLRVNRRMCEITGYTEPELMGRRVSEITHPEDRELDWEAFQRVVRGETPDYHMEKRYLCKDGSIAWVNVNMTVIRDAAGRPTRTMATIENVSERKRAEMERARLTTAMEQAVELIMITDAQGRILYVNPAFEKVTGYTRDEVMGQTPRFLKSGKQEAGYYQAMWQALSQGRVWHGRFTNRKKNGELYEEDSTISPVRNHAGEIVNYVAVKRDITREVELESQIRQSQKMEGIGQLAGGVAHDFNNILAAIMMQAQLAETIEGVPDKVAEDMVQIRLSCERGANLTRQLLLFSRKQILQLRDLNLNDIVTNITKMLKRIIGENVAIQLRLHRGPLMTHADAGMLDQVLMNLAVNGRDAMDAHGQLTIGTAEIVLDEETAARYPDAAPGRYVCLSVSDTGAGIPPAVLPRIFEPFFTTKAQGKGTGLGLATVFGIVKQHKGWIQVRTELGRGTTFDIYLPAVSAAQNAIAEAGVEARRAKGSGTILMAEDDAGVRATTRKFLELHGYTILEAGNGAEALAIWENSSARVDLLLTDLLMPGGINGRDLARQLCGERPDLKVVFFSGYSADLVGGGLVLRLGENFLQKPFTPSSLLEILRRRLGA